MRVIRPSYWKEFRCIAAQCGDNCCIGWEIDIDSESGRFYRSVEGRFGERLNREICNENGEAHFRLHGERCAFLNHENLCDIILNLGETSLCQICAEHPRFYEWFGDVKEAGLGLCCEAAGRLIFGTGALDQFETVEEEEPPDSRPFDQALYERLSLARETAYQIVQDRAKSVSDRMLLLLSFGEALQEALERNEPVKSSGLALMEHPEADVPDCYRHLLAELQSLEPMDSTWPAKLKQISAQLPELLAVRREFMDSSPRAETDYEHLLVYFLFRYLSKAVFDGDALAKIKLCVLSVLVVQLLDIEKWAQAGCLTLEDQIEIAKGYSKEVEYSVENMEVLEELCWKTNDFSSERLAAMIKYELYESAALDKR